MISGDSRLLGRHLEAVEEQHEELQEQDRASKDIAAIATEQVGISSGKFMDIHFQT